MNLGVGIGHRISCFVPTGLWFYSCFFFLPILDPYETLDVFIFFTDIFLLRLRSYGTLDAFIFLSRISSDFGLYICSLRHTDITRGYGLWRSAGGFTVATATKEMRAQSLSEAHQPPKAHRRVLWARHLLSVYQNIDLKKACQLFINEFY